MPQADPITVGCFDVRCHKCGKRFGWRGRLTSRPPCPKCGATIATAVLEAQSKKLEDALKAADKEATNAADA